MATVPLPARPASRISWPKVGWWVMAILSFASGLWGLFVSVAYPDLGAHYARMFAIPVIAFVHTRGHRTCRQSRVWRAVVFTAPR
jgi:hypothetical protein